MSLLFKNYSPVEVTYLEPTQILHNSSECIDLIFTSQPNLIIESGVHPSLHSNCHHQLKKRIEY